MVENKPEMDLRLHKVQLETESERRDREQAGAHEALLRLRALLCLR